MIVVQKDHYALLVDELQQLFPHSTTIYHLAKNHLDSPERAWSGIEFLTDQLPNLNVCVVRPSLTFPPDQHVARHNHPTYNICAKSPEALRRLLEEHDVINWKEPAFFAVTVTELMIDVLYETAQKQGHVDGPREVLDFKGVGILFHKEIMETVASPPIPDGFTIQSLRRKDMETVNSIWHFGKNPRSQQYLNYLHDHGFPAIGIFTPDDKLVGYVITSAEMSMIAAHVDPAYRGRKFFQILTIAWAKEIFALGEKETVAFVSEQNTASMTAQTRAGGQRPACSEPYNMSWMVFTPNNYANSENSIVQWMEQVTHGKNIWQT